MNVQIGGMPTNKLEFVFAIQLVFNSNHLTICDSSMVGEIVDKVTPGTYTITMTRQYNVMPACVVALLTVLQLVSCDYEPQPKTFSDYVVRGEFLTKTGRFDEAIENYHKALEIDPKSTVVYFRLGQTLRLQGKLDQANENYGKALLACPKIIVCLFGMGSVQSQGKLDAAIEKYRKVIELAPKSSLGVQVLADTSNNKAN